MPSQASRASERSMGKKGQHGRPVPPTPVFALPEPQNWGIIHLRPNPWRLLMRPMVASAVALLFLFVTVGVPAGAYSCPECGEAGVVSHLVSFPSPCCVDCCCEGDADSPDSRIRSELPCCDSDVQTVPTSSRILLPDRKKGPTETLADTPVRFDVPRSNVCIASVPLSTSVFRPSMNPPLRI